MAIYPSRPQPIGGVLDTTFQLYKASIARVLPLCVLLFIASSPPSIYMVMHGGTAFGGFGALAAMQSPTYWLIYTVSVIATLWIAAAVYLKIGAIGTGADLSIGPALQRSLGRLPTLVLTTILFIIALTIGCLLLIVPGLILMVSLLLYFNLVLFDAKGPVAALKDSHRLVWGNWWRTAAILTVGFIIIAVIYLLAGVIMGALLPFGSKEDVLMLSLVSGLAIGALMNLLVTPFYASLIIAIYWDLKLRKEGGDLAARVGALNPA